jgi:hypothetical protein
MESRINIDMMPSIKYPSYCRDYADRGKWLAWKLGFTKSISSRDKVIENKGCYKITVGDGNIIEGNK